MIQYRLKVETASTMSRKIEVSYQGAISRKIEVSYHGATSRKIEVSCPGRVSRKMELQLSMDKIKTYRIFMSRNGSSFGMLAHDPK